MGTVGGFCWTEGSEPSGFQEFTTPGAFSFTVPAGVTIVSITACGGGGAGGNTYSGEGFYNGGGGGAAIFGEKHLVTPGQTITGTIGGWRGVERREKFHGG